MSVVTFHYNFARRWPDEKKVKLEERPSRFSKVVRGSDGCTLCRCQHEGTVAYGMDVKQGEAERRKLPCQRSRLGLEAGSGMV